VAVKRKWELGTILWTGTISDHSRFRRFFEIQVGPI
jgi:hypothetical protein